MEFNETSLLLYFDDTVSCGDFAYGVFGYVLEHCGCNCKLEFNAATGEVTIALLAEGSHSLFNLSDCERILVRGNELEAVCSGMQRLLFAKHPDRLSCIARIS